MSQSPKSFETKKKGGLTRARIHNVLVKLVSERGMNGVVLRDICEGAGITHGGFYFHFKNIETALVEVAQEWLTERWTQILKVPPDDDLFTELRGMVEAYVYTFIAKLEVTRAVFALDPSHPELQAVWYQYQVRWWARLEERFRRARLEAGLKIGMENWMTSAVTTSLEGICVNTYLSALPQLVSDGIEPELVAERETVFWYRIVMGADPSDDRLVHLTAYEASKNR